MSSVLIAPSILAADPLRLKDEIADVLDATSYIHVDIMDGHFVPNISLGIPLVKHLYTNFPEANFDLHMMVTNPEKWFDDLVKENQKLGQKFIYQYTFHIEAMQSQGAARMLADKIRKYGVVPSVCLSPSTPVSAIDSLLKDGAVDNVLVMTVEPGFGGQKFNELMLGKISGIKAINPRMRIQVDGGINEETIKRCARAGASFFVVGSGVYCKKPYTEEIERLKELCC